jgi:uncharacterized radical SAM superfamily protein
MSDSLQEKFSEGIHNWSDIEELIKVEHKYLDKFLKIAFELKIKNFGQELKVYIPGKKFPAISVTGSNCFLSCEHCNHKYLKDMTSFSDELELEEILLNLEKTGGVGALISGGCLPDGSVPLLKYLDTIKKVKNQTRLIINTHTGLLNKKTAKKLAEAGVDIISFDLNMDMEIIKNIYHLKKNLDDYKNAIKLLQKYDLNIVPHICIGLHYGKLHKELDSIKFIKESGIDPSLIVAIALIPPKNSKVKFERPNPYDIAKILSILRFTFPTTEISLGCMRPRGDIKLEIEKLAIMAGINRIEIPSGRTLKWIKERYPDISFKFYSACCAIPGESEKLAISEESDLKQYQI